jgi:cyclopropane fatty-acyl-phospholipid synthase-like methyltransferase
VTSSDFERWETRFAVPDYLFGTKPNAFLAGQAARLRPGWSALSIADGEGRNGVWLAEQGLSVHAVDFSPTALAKAQKLAAARGVALRTECADLASWAWPRERYDLVAAIFIQFAPPPFRARIFEGLKSALKPGGLLLLEGYRPKQLEYATGGPKQLDQLYTRELLLEAFGALEIVSLEEHDSMIEEGSGHAGMSALIDLVARKPAPR